MLLSALMAGLISTGPAAAPAPTVNRAALDALVQRAAELDTDALVVMHRGKVVLARWFDGKPRRIEAMSVTKSVVSMAVGRLVTTGALTSLDEPFSNWFPEWQQGRKRGITIRQLLQHTSGLQADRMTGTEIYPAKDFVQLALCAELVSNPGEKFFYNNKAANLLPALVEKVSGKPIDRYLAAEVFGPLGITDTQWLADPAGHPQGMSGLRIRPEDLARLGQLMLDDGRWRGTQVLSRAFVQDAARPSSPNPAYGLQWWLVGDKTMVIDEQVLAGWTKAGADPRFVAAVRPLKNREIASAEYFGVLGQALKDVGGLKTWDEQTWKAGRSDGRVVRMETVGLHGDGWQGQHLVVLNKQQLVVVRMREPTDAADASENEKYGFGDIIKLSRALVP